MLALDDPLGGVEPEYPRSHFAYRRQWLNHRAGYFEVLLPIVSPRIEETYKATETVE